jgi:uncharacterized membrane protein
LLRPAQGNIPQVMRQCAASYPLRLLAASISFVFSLSACGSDGDDAPNDGDGTVTWCEVSEVLQAKCERCHVDEGKNGAPFPLVSYADTQVTVASRPRWQTMEAVISAETMPPTNIPLDPPVEELTSAERAVLLSWFEEGAKSVGGTDCSE